MASLRLDEAPDAEKVEDLTWTNRTIEAAPPVAGYKHYPVHAAAVLSLTAVMPDVYW